MKKAFSIMFLVLFLAASCGFNVSKACGKGVEGPMKIPPIDRAEYRIIETATFAMG
ncbi:MAG: hypothetical protein ACP5CD_03215 [Thermovirgaceae bacterium]